MRRVTGIGGIFFKSKDPQKATEWYQRHLGLNANPYGATFEWYESPDSKTKAQTQWTPFAEDSEYFDQQFMINYRVEDLEAPNHPKNEQLGKRRLKMTRELFIDREDFKEQANKKPVSSQRIQGFLNFHY